MSNIIQKFQFLEFLPNELREIRGYYELFDMLTHKSSQKLGDNIWKAWNELEKCTPKLRINPLRDFQPFNQKITVTQWVENNPIFADKLDLLGTHFNLTAHFQSIKLWSDSDNLYWLGLYFYLETWSQLVEATLDNVEWTMRLNRVLIKLKWKGVFGVVEKFNFGTPSYPFWNVSPREKNASCFHGVLTTLLLSAQLLAYRGGSLLNLIDSSQDQSIMELDITRSDTLSSESPISLLSQHNERQVGEYILDKLFSKHYISKIEQLEKATLYEIKQLESKAFINDSLQDALDKLADIRNALEKIR